MYSEEDLINNSPFPLNEDGSVMSYDELTEYLKTLPINEGELRIEDVAVRISGTIDEWAKLHGYIPLGELVKKHQQNTNEK